MYYILISTNGTATIRLHHTYMHRGTLTHTTCSLYITPHHYTFGRSRITDPVVSALPLAKGFSPEVGYL
jgi:hypothetical protein